MDASLRRAEFDAAFAARYVRARRLAFAILGDVEAAEDVAEEALVRTLTRWHRIRMLRHQDAWVLRTTAVVAIDAARRRPVRVAARTAGTTDHDDDLVALDPAVADALVRLPANQRLALALVELAGCSPADAAAVMNSSAATVGTLVGRAIDRIGAAVPASASAPWRSAGAIG